MKFYINRKILTGFVVSILVIAGSGLISYQYFNDLLQAMKWGAHSRKVLYHAEQVRSYAIEIETSQRGFGLTGSPIFLEPFFPAVKQIHIHLKDLDSLTSDNANQQKRIVKLRDAVTRRIKFAEEVLLLRKESFESARNLMLSLKGKKLTDEIKGILGEIQDEENNLIMERSLIARSEFYRFVTTSLILLASTIIILIVLTYLINTNLKSRMVAEGKLIEAHQETKKVNQELEAFTYSVSHDLRAPLRSIDGYAQILKEDYCSLLDDEGNRVINVIMTNAKRMGQLIDDLLAFSRLGRQEIKKSRINTNEFVRSIIDDLLLQHKEKNREVLLDIHPLNPSLADVNMIRQVWINLLSNALKYTQRKDIPRIEIGCHDATNETTYYVKDNGAGFDMQYYSKLFGVFQRLHKVSDFEGTGVGLALVKRIIERHHGKIWAEAKVNEGATFYFTIPKQ